MGKHSGQSLVEKSKPEKSKSGTLLTPAEKQANQFNDMWRKKRKLAIEEALQRFTPEERERIKGLAKAEKQDIAVDLLMAGASRNTAEIVLGLQHGQIAMWVNSETATMQQKMHDGCSKKAILEFPETFQRLADLRFHPNAETARKASLDMARAAGRGIDAPAPPSLTVNMNGQNNQFNLSTRELEEKILQFAEALGPEAVKLAKGELGVQPVGFNAARAAAPDGGAALKADQGAAPAP